MGFKIYHEQYGLLTTERIYVRHKECVGVPEHIFKAMYPFPWEVVAIVKDYRPINPGETPQYPYEEITLQSFKEEFRAQGFLKDGVSAYTNPDNRIEPIWWIYLD